MIEDLECVINDSNTVSIIESLHKTTTTLDKNKVNEAVKDKYFVNEKVKKGKVKMTRSQEHTPTSNDAATSFSSSAIVTRIDINKRRSISPSKRRRRPVENNILKKHLKKDLRNILATSDSGSFSLSERDLLSPSSRSCQTDDDDDENLYSNGSDDNYYDDSTDEAYESDRTPNRRDYEVNSDTDNCSTSSRDQTDTDCSYEQSSYTSTDNTNCADEYSDDQESHTDTDNESLDDCSRSETGTEDNRSRSSSEGRSPRDSLMSSKLLVYDRYMISPSKRKGVEQVSAQIENIKISSRSNNDVRIDETNNEENNETGMDFDAVESKENIVTTTIKNQVNERSRSKKKTSSTQPLCPVVERHPLKGKQTTSTDEGSSLRRNGALKEKQTTSSDQGSSVRRNDAIKAKQITSSEQSSSIRRRDPKYLLSQNDSNATPLIENLNKYSPRASNVVSGCTIPAELRDMPSILEKKKSLKKTLTKKQQQQDIICDSTKTAPQMDGSLLMTPQKNAIKGRKSKWVGPVKKFIGGLVS
jgi:hypothetical protein